MGKIILCSTILLVWYPVVAIHPQCSPLVHVALVWLPIMPLWLQPIRTSRDMAAHTTRWRHAGNNYFLRIFWLWSFFFFKGFKVSDFKIKTTQRLIINLFEVKDHPVNSFTAVIYYIIVREKNAFGPNGIFWGCNTSSGHWGVCGGWSDILKKTPAKWKQEVQDRNKYTQNKGRRNPKNKHTACHFPMWENTNSVKRHPFVMSQRYGISQHSSLPPCLETTAPDGHD